MRRKEYGVMLVRSTMLMVSILLVMTLAIQPSWSKKCGICHTQRVRMCDESVCGVFPACMGPCECEEWNSRSCQGDGLDCRGTHVGNVPVTVYPGNCDNGTRSCVCRTDPSVPPFRQLRPKDVCTPC